jgi:hypothetical protein
VEQILRFERIISQNLWDFMFFLGDAIRSLDFLGRISIS